MALKLLILKPFAVNKNYFGMITLFLQTAHVLFWGFCSNIYNYLC